MITTICVLFVFLFDFYNCSRSFITLIHLLFYSYNYLKNILEVSIEDKANVLIQFEFISVIF